MRRKLLLLLIAWVNAVFIFGQQDTLFWFSPPKMPAGITATSTKLILKSFDQSADVTVSVPANNTFTTQTVTLAANSVQELDFSSLFSLFYPSNSAVYNNGLLIESTAPISSEWVVSNTSYKEEFSLKGNMALGTDFYVPAQNFWNINVNGNSGFSIVATENNTTLLITPKVAATTSTSTGATTTFSIVIQKGQSYFVQKQSLGGNSLAGSIVASNKPVAVTMYEHGTSNGTCTDLIGDQLVSSDYLGTTFVATRLSSEDRVFVMAVENGTQVTYNGATTEVVNLSWGETRAFPLSADFSYISSTKKVYLYQVTAKDCEFSASLVPNATCAGSYVANLTRKSSDPFILNLYTRQGFENGFTMNGAPLSLNGATFQPVAGTNGAMVAISLPLPSVPVGGLIQIANPLDIFGASSYNGASGSGSFYSFTSDYTVTTFANAGANATTCANVGFDLNGLVGGGAISGNWVSTGYGTFAQPSTDLVNTYQPSPLDVLISPIRLILTSTGDCPSKRDTLLLTVSSLPVVNASIDQVVCSNNSDVQLAGNVQAGSTTGTWTTSGSGTFSPDANTLDAIYIPSQADLQTAGIDLVLTSTNNGNCAAESDLMHITFTNPAVVDIALDSITVCFNNPVVNLAGTVTGSSTTGKWITEGGGMFFPNNIQLNTSYQPGLTDLNTGNVWIYLESTNNGQCIPVRDSIKVIISPSPVVDAGLNRLICMTQDTINLVGTANGNFGGTWSGGLGTFDNANSLTTTYTVTEQERQNGTVTLTLTSSNNGSCISNSDVVQFNFVEVPYVNFTIADGCLGVDQAFTNFSLAGSGSITQTNWQFGDNETSTLMNPNHQYAAAGNYNVTLTVTNSNGCVSTDTRTAIVHDKPNADFTYDSTCDFQTYTVNFVDASSATDGIQAYLYDLGGQVNFSTPNFSYDFSQTGTYYISQIVTSINGCKDTITKPITIHSFPIAGFAYNFTSGMNVGTTFNFVDTSDFASTFLWEFGDGNTSTDQEPSNVYYQNGFYNIIQWVYNQNGCYDSTSAWVEIKNVTSDIQTLIPNVISPNGDGYNDVWKLSFINIMYPKAEVNIFNQWGQLVFESEGYQTPWDGRYKGEDVPDGNYYYVIKLNDGNDDSVYKGALLVLRSTK